MPPSDIRYLSNLTSELHDLKAKLGQAVLNHDAFVSQVRDIEAQHTREQNVIRSSIGDKTAEIQSFSKSLLDKLEVDTSSGNWSIDLEKGVINKDPFVCEAEKIPQVKRKKSTK